MTANESYFEPDTATRRVYLDDFNDIPLDRDPGPDEAGWPHDEPDEPPVILQAVAAPVDEKASDRAEGFVFTDLRTITARDVEWHDRPFLPAGEFVVNVGDGDIGKGLLAVHFTTQFTLGERGERRMVVFAVAEDAFDTVLKPRLLAAGADLEHVRTVNFRRKGLEDAICIPDDVPALEEPIGTLNAGLLIIDPLLSHFSGKTNSYVDHEVKRALQPIVDLAHRTGCTVLGNHHLTKDTSRGARAAAQSSNAFINTPRVAWAMAADDDDPDVRVVEVIKSNIGPKNVGRNYRVSTVPVDGLDEPQPTLVRESAASKSVDDLLTVARHGKRVPAELVRAVVLRELETGEKPRKYLDDAVKEETGANADSVYKSALTPLKNDGVIAARKDGPDGGWYWHLTPGGVA